MFLGLTVLIFSAYTGLNKLFHALVILFCITIAPHQ